MKSLVIYDSLYGNTEKIAQVIAHSLSTEAILFSKINAADLEKVDLLIVGSPTHGGRPTVELHKFLENLPENSLNNKKVAVFDTRLLEQDLNFALKLLVRIIGYAAPKMAKLLEAKGGTLLIPPEGFIVKGKEGPLAPDEIERAQKWLQVKTI